MGVAVGKAVDDRHGSMPHELGQSGMEGGPGHDRVDQATDHARRVGHRLVTAQVDLAGAKVLRVAAQLAHARLEADARARGRMFEDHRQRATRKEGRERTATVQCLESDRQVEEAHELIAGVVLVGEEMAAAQGSEAGQRGRVHVRGTRGRGDLPRPLDMISAAAMIRRAVGVRAPGSTASDSRFMN